MSLRLRRNTSSGRTGARRPSSVLSPDRARISSDTRMRGSRCAGGAFSPEGTFPLTTPPAARRLSENARPTCSISTLARHGRRCTSRPSLATATSSLSSSAKPGNSHNKLKSAEQSFTRRGARNGGRLDGHGRSVCWKALCWTRVSRSGLLTMSGRSWGVGSGTRNAVRRLGDFE